MTDEPIPPDVDVDFPLPDGLKVTTDRPFRILFMADLGGGAEGDLAGPFADQLVDVNAENLDELMSAAHPAVSFKTTDPVRGGGLMVEVALRFDSLKAFQPDAVLQRIPQTKALLDAREAIVTRMRGKTSASELTDRVKQMAAAEPQLDWLPEAIHWTPSEAPPPDDVVDNLLGQFDLGDESAEAPPPKTPIGAAVSAAAAAGGAQIPAAEASALRRTLGQIDQRATAWLNAVLHEPCIQHLESAWHGLALLVSNLEFRKGLRLSVLHATQEQIAERLVSRVIDPVFDEGAEAPSLIVADYLFGQTAPGFELLDELAQHAASLPVVALTGLSAGFFGVKHAWQVPTLPAFVSLFDQWQFAKWKTLRGEAYARSLGVIFGRALLRSPHKPPKPDDLAFAYSERCISDKDFIWTSGAVVAAITIGRSMAETGWPTGLVDRVAGFATGLGGKKGDKQYGPADTEMTLDKAQDLAVAGINGLVGGGADKVVVCNGFSAARPDRAEGFALLEVSLPYQLFAARLSSLLLELKPYLSGMSPEKLVAFTLAHVRDWLTVEDVKPDEQQIAAQARPLDDEPESLQLAVTVTPPPGILPGGVPVVLGYRIR